VGVQLIAVFLESSVLTVFFKPWNPPQSDLFAADGSFQGVSSENKNLTQVSRSYTRRKAVRQNFSLRSIEASTI